MASDQQPETLSLEVVRLCALLARIICRGVMERDPRVLALFSPSASSVENKGVPNGSAA
jgi:hypothetical protein